MKLGTRSVLYGALMLSGCGPSQPQPVPANHELHAQLARMERRANILRQSADEIEARYQADVLPVERVLVGRARDPLMARRAAWAIVLEAEKRHLPPMLMAEIMRTENPWLVGDTVSFAGAVGWMQVMPFHALDSRHEECGPDLTDGPTSTCYGSDIFRIYLGEELARALRTALLRYNGCVRTPGCSSYADSIMARTARRMAQ